MVYGSLHGAHLTRTTKATILHDSMARKRKKQDDEVANAAGVGVQSEEAVSDAEEEWEWPTAMAARGRQHWAASQDTALPYSSQSAPPPPLWEGPPPRLIADVPEAAVQFSVQWLDNGRPQDLGFISVDANEFDLIRMFGKAGTYRLWPINMNGERLTSEPYVKDISEAHQAFRRMHGSTNGGSAAGVMLPSQMWEYMQQALLLQREAADRAAKEAAEARRMAQEAIERAAKERLSVATQNTTQIMDLQERIIAQDAERQERFLMRWVEIQREREQAEARLHELRLKELEAQQRQREQEHQRELERIRQEAQERREAELAAREREREWEQQRRMEERQDMQRREREREEWLNRRMDLEREATKERIALITAKTEANDPFKLVERIIGKKDELLGLAAGLGIDFSKVFSSGTLADTIARSVDKMVEGVIELKKLDVLGGTDDEEGETTYTFKLENGQQIRVTESQLLQLVAQQQQSAAANQLPGPPAAGAADDVAGDVQSDAARYNLGPQVPSAQAQPTQAQPTQAQRPVTSTLPAAVQKAGRKAVRLCLSDLRKAQHPDQWIGIIVRHLKEHDALVPYLRDVSISGALREAGAEDSLIEQIIERVDASGMVPPDVPR